MIGHDSDLDERNTSEIGSTGTSASFPGYAESTCRRMEFCCAVRADDIFVSAGDGAEMDAKRELFGGNQALEAANRWTMRLVTRGR